MAEKSTGKRAKEFENYIMKWLKTLGFKDRNGGPNFVINGIQVDACAGHEDNLIVIECKSAGKKIKRSIRDDIKRVRGVMNSLRKGFRSDPTYKKYNNILHVLALKNIELTDADRDFARMGPPVYIWDEQIIEYYEGLARIIGEYARFGLLGEMGVKPRISGQISYPALRCKLDKYVAYSFLAEPDKLLRVAYVARREVGNEKYYQRILKRDRLNKIERFIRKGGIFPNNIILSFQKAPSFKEIRQDWTNWPDWVDFGILTFPDTYRNCWIIDGQHRLYSFSKLKPPLVKLPILAFEKLDIDKQSQFFVEINKEQKPVDPDLLWDLEGDMRPNSTEGVVSNIVKMLATSGPLDGKIYIPLRGRRKRGQLKFSAICNAIIDMKITEPISRNMVGANKNPLYDNDPETRKLKTYKALSSYFETLQAKLSDLQIANLLYKNTSMEVLIAFFEIILSYLCHIPSNEELNEFIDALKSSLDSSYPNENEIKKILERCASKGGRAEVLKELVESVRNIIQKPDFGKLVVSHHDEADLANFERSLAKFVLNKLNVSSYEDLRKIAPKGIADQVSSRCPEAPPDEQLTLGECKEIMFYSNNWQKLKDFFVQSQIGFNNQKEVESGLEAVSAYRNKIKHGRFGQITYNEPVIARAYMDKFRRCLGY